MRADETVLEERAKKLARERHDPDSEAGAEAEILVLQANGGRYGLRSFEAMEVVEADHRLPAPGASELVWGLFSLHGELYPLVRLEELVEGDVRAAGNGPGPERAWVVMIGSDGAEVGLAVGSVPELVSVKVAEIQRIPESREEERLVKAVTSGGLGLLDLQALLNAVHEESSSVNPERDAI